MSEFQFEGNILESERQLTPLDREEELFPLLMMDDKSGFDGLDSQKDIESVQRLATGPGLERLSTPPLSPSVTAVHASESGLQESPRSFRQKQT